MHPGPKFGRLKVFRPLSVRYRPKADTRYRRMTLLAFRHYSLGGMPAPPWYLVRVFGVCLSNEKAITTWRCDVRYGAGLSCDWRKQAHHR